jgi:hypothetical protein
MLLAGLLIEYPVAASQPKHLKFAFFPEDTAMNSLRLGIGDDSIKCVRGNPSRAVASAETDAFQQNHIHLASVRRDR